MADENAAGQETGPMTVDSAAAAIQSMGLLNDEPEETSAPAQEDTPTGDDAGPDESPATGDEAGTDEPDESPAIEPPSSWASDEKEAFKALPPDIQKRIAEREAERERTKSQSLREIAEQRKAVEAERAQAQQERQHYAQQLQSFVPLLQQQLQGKYAQVDWVKLSREDPAQYVALRAEYDTDVSRLRLAQAEQLRLQKQEEQEREARAKAFIDEQRAKLFEKLPDLRDTQKRSKFVSDVDSYLKDRSFTEDEIRGLVDHRMMLVVRDAMLYAAAQKSKEQAAKKVVNVPKVQKPGTRNTSRNETQAAEAEAAMNRLRKSGRVDDAAEAIRRLGIL